MIVMLSRRTSLALALSIALACLGADGPRPASVPAPRTAPPATRPAPAPAAASQAAPALERSLASRLAAMEQAIERRREELAVPGAALVVVQGDRVIYLKGLGLKDRERKLAATPDTRFAIASCTKAFTAMLAVMAQDDGKLRLDDPPRKYLPYFKLADPASDAGVTLRDLLSHRTGLDSEDSSLWYQSGLDREQAIRGAMAAKPVAPLRTAFHYNNLLYSAAGEVVARAEGVSWERLVESRIFAPLGMKSTDTSNAAMQKSPDFALGYSEGRPRVRVPQLDLTNGAPAGAIDSTARDMAQWLRLMLGRGVYRGRRLVSERGFAELYKKHIQMREGVYYCLGWGVKDWHGHATYGHRGGIDGFNSIVSLMPDRKLGMVMLTNVTLSDLTQDAPDIVWEHLVGE
jgi:CubicO group peptidase (beta-lactamase class C family)